MGYCSSNRKRKHPYPPNPTARPSSPPSTATAIARCSRPACPLMSLPSSPRSRSTLVEARASTRLPSRWRPSSGICGRETDEPMPFPRVPRYLQGAGGGRLVCTSQSPSQRLLEASVRDVQTPDERLGVVHTGGGLSLAQMAGGLSAYPVASPRGRPGVRRMRWGRPGSRVRCLKPTLTPSPLPLALRGACSIFPLFLGATDGYRFR